MANEPQMPTEGAEAKPQLLTDQQVAERMGWSKQKVQRLRLAGQLPFYPGRPPLIEAADLDRLKVRRAGLEVKAEISTPAAPAPRTPAAQKETPEQRARRVWLRTHRNFPR